ncbi:MAG: metal-dependent hydrolase [Cytophagales bacterium]|jgi:inner membrane protein|nr:metal-dependent hydrolase [Cytophagales bacterium]MCA6388821.1 metal-dependent hydrolase [Cytophagales bacterium]MCA6390706.1 metal-dependent hydrolase [Cytophagales bacterium]MCA6395976.1 metal-dependent hydrolase [Cytophagales bacterium]MCA6398215.1 metal-dependent hydrolase [Cytophagales bacterium]
MDSFTHIALGGLLGEALLGKKLGKRALVLGAIAQSLPDIDFIASLWLDASDNLLAHRGFTHSFVFATAVTPLLAFLATVWHPHAGVSFRNWSAFFGIQIVVHLLIDSLNAYGVGWLVPFSAQRFSFNVLFVADPFYSIWLGIALLALIVVPAKSRNRVKWTVAGLVLSSTYLVYTIANKYEINNDVQRIIKQQHVAFIRYFSTPTPLNNWLWYVVVEEKNGYQIGYRSVFDQKDSILFHYFPKNDLLLESVRSRKDVRQLQQFSQGYYSISQRSDALVFSELRFGQQAGWYDPQANFVFQYDLTHPSKNQLAVQRGRFAGWNSASVKALLKRIKGD